MNPLKRREEGGATPPLEDWGVNSEYGTLRDVLLGRPDYYKWLATSSISKATLASGQSFDLQDAQAQHRELVDAYERAGVTVHFVEPEPDLPYQVYTRDSSFMTPYGAVVCQMNQWWRRGEYGPVIRFYTDLGIPIYDMVTASAFEGGDFDVIEPGSVLIGFCGERSQEPAARQIGRWFEAEGWEVRLERIDSFYVHIDLMVCMLAEKMAAVCLETTSDGVIDWLKGKGIEIVPVGFRDTMLLGCNVMSLGNDRIISTRDSSDLNAKLRANGFEVFDPDVSIFTKGGGGVHCMAQPLRRDPV